MAGAFPKKPLHRPVNAPCAYCISPCPDLLALEAGRRFPTASKSIYPTEYVLETKLRPVPAFPTPQNGWEVSSVPKSMPMTINRGHNSNSNAGGLHLHRLASRQYSQSPTLSILRTFPGFSMQDITYGLGSGHANRPITSRSLRRRTSHLQRSTPQPSSCIAVGPVNVMPHIRLPTSHLRFGVSISTRLFVQVYVLFCFGLVRHCHEGYECFPPLADEMMADGSQKSR